MIQALWASLLRFLRNVLSSRDGNSAASSDAIGLPYLRSIQREEAGGEKTDGERERESHLLVEKLFQSVNPNLL